MLSTRRFILMFATVCPIITQANAADNGAAEVQAPIEKIYVPYGFDDNDNVEIVLHGHFPDSCYKVGKTGATVDEQNKIINVWATALHYPVSGCVKAPIAFIQTIRIGTLGNGTYKIALKDSNLFSPLAVKRRTTEAPEDYLYAPVASVSLNQPMDQDPQVLTLRGTYPYMFIGCMKIVEVRLTQKQPDLLEVQPITKIFPDEECDLSNEFEVTQQVPHPLLGEGLVHVRVLNGDSINQYVPIRR